MVQFTTKDRISSLITQELFFPFLTNCWFYTKFPLFGTLKKYRKGEAVLKCSFFV